MLTFDSAMIYLAFLGVIIVNVVTMRAMREPASVKSARKVLGVCVAALVLVLIAPVLISTHDTAPLSSEELGQLPHAGLDAGLMKRIVDVNQEFQAAHEGRLAFWWFFTAICLLGYPIFEFGRDYLPRLADGGEDGDREAIES